jgi:hypothetical protein
MTHEYSLYLQVGILLIPALIKDDRYKVFVIHISMLTGSWPNFVNAQSHYNKGLWRWVMPLDKTEEVFLSLSILHNDKHL